MPDRPLVFVVPQAFLAVGEPYRLVRNADGMLSVAVADGTKLTFNLAQLLSDIAERRNFMHLRLNCFRPELRRRRGHHAYRSGAIPRHGNNSRVVTWRDLREAAGNLTGMSSDHIIVSSTTDSEEAARALATSVVEAHLGACAQIVGPIVSVYRWEGKVETAPEWRVEIKTAADRVAELTDHIKANHTYDLPEIVATPITGGSAEYLAWVVEESRPIPSE